MFLVWMFAPSCVRSLPSAGVSRCTTVIGAVISARHVQARFLRPVPLWSDFNHRLTLQTGLLLLLMANNVTSVMAKHIWAARAERWVVCRNAWIRVRRRLVAEALSFTMVATGAVMLVQHVNALYSQRTPFRSASLKPLLVPHDVTAETYNKVIQVFSGFTCTIRSNLYNFMTETYYSEFIYSNFL